MAEATVESVRAEVSAAFESYMTELKQSAPNWDTRPEGATEGEAAWSPRQVAEHIAGSGLYFAAGIAKAIGIEGAEMQRFQLESADVAVSKTTESHASLMGVVDQIEDAQLSTRIEKTPIGDTTVGGLVALVAHHLKDHAGQLKTLRDA